MADLGLDFRSDTVTQPTAAMRAAMAEAPLGDDVFGEDPTLNRLEERVAEMLGKEAAVYVPSGTMSNHIATFVHCAPGDELLCEVNAHFLNMEQVGHVQLNGVSHRTVEGDFGVVEVDQFVGLIRPDDEHCARTRLVCLENTHNRGAGRILPYANVEAICAWARDNGLATHLDGARLFNAVVATGIAADQWAQHFDTVSVCFSKGLGAPVGSALAGSRELIDKARRRRKVLGGGMRQGGLIAAGALYALENHIDRLSLDHATAQQFAEVIRNIEGLELAPDVVDTNMVAFEVDPRLGTAGEFVGRLADEGLKMGAVGPTRVRAVAHLNLDADAVERAAPILQGAAAAATSGPAASAAV